MGDLAQIRTARIEREYRALRAIDPDLFGACVRSAEAVVFNLYRELAGVTEADRARLAAAIESALVSIAMEARRG